MFSFICTGTNDWANDRDAGDLKRHRALYDVTVMIPESLLGVNDFNIIFLDQVKLFKMEDDISYFIFIII